MVRGVLEPFSMLADVVANASLLLVAMNVVLILLTTTVVTDVMLLRPKMLYGSLLL